MNQLVCVILVHIWYRSTSMCFHVFCLLLQVLNEFDTSHTGSELVWFHWYVSSREKIVNSLSEHVKSRVLVCWVVWGEAQKPPIVAIKAHQKVDSSDSMGIHGATVSIGEFCF